MNKLLEHVQKDCLYAESYTSHCYRKRKKQAPAYGLYAAVVFHMDAPLAACSKISTQLLVTAAFEKTVGVKPENSIPA